MILNNLGKEERFLEHSGMLAYENVDFMNIPACRPFRLGLEYVRPDMAMDIFDVESTVVMLGSARTLSPEKALERLDAAREAFARAPGSQEAMADLNKAEDALKASHYYEVAREFAEVVTRESQLQDKTDRTFVIITGGGGGIMEAGNRGARDGGGISIGLNIDLPFEQHPNEYITPELSFKFNYFCIRKMHFVMRAKAVACFPGGFGTMDELFEVLTLVQTGKVRKMPIIMYGREFWEKLINWDLYIERGMISADDLKLLTYCETAQEGWDVIQKYYGRN